ncbi:MAG: hypothetical protein ACI8VI_001507, partial [Granulosicoccus sp.]
VLVHEGMIEKLIVNRRNTVGQYVPICILNALDGNECKCKSSI